MFSKEDYVSLEVANLLKEKGFDEPCLSQYTKSGTIWNCQEPENFNESEGCFSRPTLYEAQKWLLDKHNIYVYPSVYLSKYNDESSLYIIESYKYNGNCWESFELNLNKYDTYEDALNAGILEALKLI